MKVELVFTTILLCAGCGANEPVTPPSHADDPIPTIRLDEAWPVVIATEEAAGVFDTSGWNDVWKRRRYHSAAPKLQSLGGSAAARPHLEAGALYRQGALVAANSAIQAYDEMATDTDPIGVSHLLTVSYAITGDLDKAREASARVGGEGDPTGAWHGPWKTWLDGRAAWPPDLSALPVPLPEVSPGEWPEIPPSPHYALPEPASDRTRDMADPAALLVLAWWHDAAAKAAAPDSPGLETYRVGYRLPMESKVSPAGDLPLELLFGSDLLEPSDADFLAAAHADGPTVVDDWADRSLLALLVQRSRVDGKIEVQKATDVARALRLALVERATERTAGEPKKRHQYFADVARIGALRGMGLIAELEGDQEVSGSLFRAAWDTTDSYTRCPVGLVAYAAWDADHRSPIRALETMHQWSRVYPALEVARPPLDVMALKHGLRQTGGGASF